MRSSLAAYRAAYVGAIASFGEYAYPVLRIGLGLVLLLGGVHKVVAPEVWTVYAAPWVRALWPESLLTLSTAMRLNGLVEVGFGAVLIAGVYTPIAAGIVALSLVGVLVDLLSVALTSGRFVDVLLRDLGLLVLAIGVTVLAARREDRAGDAEGPVRTPGHRSKRG